VVPALLRDGAATMVKLVQRLQMQHAWFEKHWVTLVPHLDALARGYRPDLDVFSRLIQQLTAMYEEHMTLEDSLAYPQAKAQLSPQDLRIMTREMAQRRHKSTHGQGPDELFDDDESS
jgi:hemerythrin-like domain-containing protein